MLFTKSRSRLPVLVALLGTLSAPAWGAPLEDTVDVLGEWVETERLISQAEAEWESDKSSMENLLTVYRQEIETLDAIIQEAESDTSAAERRRAELMEQDDAVKKVEASLTEKITATERQILSLEPVLPPPLRDELRPLFNSIPKDPQNTKLSLGQRIQPIVAILTQVQKFNQVVTLVEDFREFEQGRTVQTETVYFGLAVAYYVDQANEHAGVGMLGEGGWQWSQDDSLISAVRGFVDIYRGTQQARYIELPVKVQ